MLDPVKKNNFVMFFKISTKQQNEKLYVYFKP